MPVFDEEAVRAAIAAGSLSAVSVDTSIFDNYRCNLDNQLLRSLGQFKGTSTQVILSEVTVGEITAHIARHAEDAQAKLKAALNLLRKGWRRPVDHAQVYELLGLRSSPAEFAQASVERYVDDVGIEVLSSDGLVSHSEVLRRYFSVLPPFSAGALKKSEFPDAIALLSLEAWATDNLTTLLLVSRDKDWHHFAASSSNLYAVNDLSAALDLFNSAGAFVVAKCLELLRPGEQSEFKVDITGALESFLDSLMPEIDAYSVLAYELDHIDCALQRWAIDPKVTPKIAKMDAEAIVFVLTIDAWVLFHATFRYFVADSIDRDQVDLGTDSKDIEQLVPLQVVVTIDRTFESEPAVRSIEVESQKVAVWFDCIDPDWGHEE